MSSITGSRVAAVAAVVMCLDASPALALPFPSDSNPVVFRITASNAIGRGTFEATYGQGLYDQVTQRYVWELPSPVVILDTATSLPVAKLLWARVEFIDDPVVNLSFFVQAPPFLTEVSLAHPLLPFPTISPAQGRASVKVTVTDTGFNGASFTGLEAGGGSYLAQYNGLVPGGTTFAELLRSIIATPGTSNSAAASFPGGGAFSPIPDPVSNMSAEFHFNLTANDLPDGTSQWEVISLFEPPQEFIASGEPIIHALGDFDGNGTVDVAAVIPDLNPRIQGRVQVFRNLGEDVLGTWQGLLANPPNTVGHAPSGVAAGLFNADDDLDLAVTNAGDDNVYVLLNFGTGNATFFLAPIVPVGNGPSAVTSDDFNEDSRADLAVTNKDDGTLTILLGDGNGNFTPIGGSAAAIPVGVLPVALSGGDFDNNKCPDLAGVTRGAVGRAQAGTVFVLLSLGGGNYEPPVQYTIGSLPTDLTVGNFGGLDSSVDIAAVNSGSNTASFLMNQGDGAFIGPFSLDVGLQPLSIDALDANADGDLDVSVVAETEGSRTAQVFLNQGGVFNFVSTVPQNVNADANFRTPDIGLSGIDRFGHRQREAKAGPGEVHAHLGELPAKRGDRPGPMR